jgi:signal transduction histidine kinase
MDTGWLKHPLRRLKVSRWEFNRLQRRSVELAARQNRIDARLTEFERSRDALLRLATFPEQNPNHVIETDRDGRVTYLNPIARGTLPDLEARGLDHPMLRGLQPIIAAFERGERDTVSREVEVGDAVYEQKICATREGERLVVRIYAHDVTARTRAEAAIQTLAKQVVQAQEEERHRVSRELHDEAGQALTALKISLQLIQAELPPEAAPVAADLADAIALVDTTRERIRVLAHDLRPPALDAVGLNLTLEDFCRGFAGRTGLAIEYSGVETDAAAPLPDAVSICIYRCLQESLANVARHAEARQVKVALRREGGEVRLVVEDDGKGFDPRSLGASRGAAAGIGLVGMSERIELLGGSLDIAAAPGRGTRLEACLPTGDPR